MAVSAPTVLVVSFLLFVTFAVSGYVLGTHSPDVTLTTPRTTNSEWKTRRHDDITGVVLVTDVLAGILFMVYFIEDAPWHKTQDREHVFLTFILAMVFSAPCILWFDPTHGLIRRNYDQLFHLMMATLLVRVAMNMTAPERYAGFFEYRAKSDFLERGRPPGSLKAMRTVTQVNNLIDELLNLQRGFCAKISDAVFNIIMLSLFMLVQLTTLLPVTLLTRAHYIIYAWWAVIWAIMLSALIKRWTRIRPRQNSIDHLLSSTLSDPDATPLRYMLWELNIPTLMDVGTPTTTDLVSEKALKRGCLGVIEKAIIVDALQKRGIKLWREHQQTVASLFLSCRGSELTVLKNLIDTGGDYYNVYKLVYQDMTSRRPRQAIQLHLREEALALRSHTTKYRQGTRGGVGIKILSDVDDTLYSSGGKFPAGCDKTFPKHRVYPGCLELFKALDWSYEDSASSSSLVFLSARPHVYKSLTEDHTYLGFRSLLDDKRLHSLPTLLPGSLARGIYATVAYCWLKTKAWRRVGEFKYSTFKKYAQLYLEYDYVFCGDNGQGDLLAGQLMVTDSPELSDSESDSFADHHVNPNPKVLAVLIHEVMPDEEVLALEPPSPDQRDTEWRGALARQRIFFHRTYLGAALHVYEACPGLLSAKDLQQIAEEGAVHFEADMIYCDWTGCDRSKYKQAFQEDYECVAQLLQKAGITLRRLNKIGDPLPHHTSGISGVSCQEEELSSDGSEDVKLLL